MRNVVTISLPKQLDEQIEKEVKTGKFASKSEFVRCLIRMWQEEKLAKEIAEAERDIAAGRVREIKSLKELR
jgi:Predicted transcriptional regulators containing the CopG/Arc/MetJ DNA-binding domain